MLKKIRKNKLDIQLIKATENWSIVKWRGHQIWQNLFDLNIMSEYIFHTKPDVIIETGTWKGGSAMFFADIMSLTGKKPNIISIDHNPRATPKHPGVKYLKVTSSTDQNVINQVRLLIANKKAFVVLDSNHEGAHVYEELIMYNQFIPINHHILVQDGNLYKSLGWKYKKTPLWGIEKFLSINKNFIYDADMNRYPVTSHTHGWLKRIK